MDDIEKQLPKPAKKCPEQSRDLWRRTGAQVRDHELEISMGGKAPRSVALACAMRDAGVWRTSRARLFGPAGPGIKAGNNEKRGQRPFGFASASERRD
ncbi:MAG: hypothetical protein H7Z39_02080 [Burkholderiaceae bacterium]|nr:hypothetical protein [Burkholderiaceae bacterium]